MKRWLGATLVAFLASLWVLLHRVTDASLLADTDTHVALEAIRARHQPLSWFAGDWPLANHFYRPISTLFFELDNALYGNWAPGYGWTNAILAALCTGLLGWFIRELTDRPVFAIVGTVLFAHLQAPFLPITEILGLWALIAAVGGFLRHRFALRNWISAPLVISAVSTLVSVAYPLATALMWIPARTATSMTVFCLLAMAAYARYERVGADRTDPEITPLTPPATRSSRISVRQNPTWLMGIVLVSVALALGSYEQAVMLPACLLGIAVSFRLRGHSVRWKWQIGFWTLLFGYIALRTALVPSQLSRYQGQQVTFGLGMVFSLLTYILPALKSIYLSSSVAEFGLLEVWLLPTFWGTVQEVAAQAAAVYEARRRAVFVVTGWALSLLAFLPMAFLKPFDHYHYWPLALRTVLITALAWVAVDLTVSAWSPRGSSTPPRPRPAPGSLPRP